MEDLVLPVPETLPALYLVPCVNPNGPLLRQTRRAVAAHVAEPLRSLTLRLLGTQILTMDVRAARSFRVLPATTRDAVVTSEQVEMVTGAEQFVAFGSLLRPLPGPLHEWLTRAAASSFADDADLPVIDGHARTITTADRLLGTLPGSPALAAAEGGFSLSDWVTVLAGEEALTTSGMERFGLPELRVTDVPPDHYLAWGMALIGVGERLHSLLRCELRRFPGAAFLQVPAEPVVTTADMGRAHGLPFHGDARFRVRLALDPAVNDTLDSYLTVEAPSDWTGTPGEHRMALRDLLSAGIESYLQACAPG